MKPPHSMSMPRKPTRMSIPSVSVEQLFAMCMLSLSVALRVIAMCMLSLNVASACSCDHGSHACHACTHRLVAIKTYKMAVETHMENNRFSTAAKLWKGMDGDGDGDGDGDAMHVM